MANYRNEFEFRSGLLDALGVEHSEADAKNEERWRAKMLDGLGVEYNQNDVNQFDLFRAKLVEGVENYSGGGSSWQTVFEGSVTTEGAEGVPTLLENVNYLTADTIKVTFDGTEYTCEKTTDESPFGTASVYGDSTFTEYPFMIISTETDTRIRASAGTYTLKIEEQSGGGSSDFSTAEVTVNNSASNTYIDFSGIIIDNDTLVPMTSLSEATSVLTVVLYKNTQHLTINADSITSTSGNISGNMLDGFDVTGDCVINAVGYSDMG